MKPLCQPYIQYVSSNEKMVVSELGHPLYLCLHVMCGLQGNVIDYVRHVLRQEIHVETSG